MTQTNTLIEATEGKPKNSQAKFAKENARGLDALGKELKRILRDFDKELLDAKQKLRNKTITDGEFFAAKIQAAGAFQTDLEILRVALTIKLTSAFAHAINSNTTETLRKIVAFMDTYGINDKLLISDLRNVASHRQIGTDDFLVLCAIVAAQQDDLEFIKILEKFTKKNVKRENIYEVFIQFSENGEMDRLSRIFLYHDRIAFEALISGSQQVYSYLKSNQEISVEYLKKFVVKSDFWIKRLNHDEVANVLKLEPEYITLFYEHMPENLPKIMVDIFLY